MPELFGHDLEDEVAVTRWAFALPAEDRDRLLLASASMLAGEDPSGPARAMGPAGTPLLPGVGRRSTRHATRTGLRFSARALGAPKRCCWILAFDVQLQAQAVSPARPPPLSEAALLQLVTRGEPDTQRVLAARSALPGSVVDALITPPSAAPPCETPSHAGGTLTEDQAARSALSPGRTSRGVDGRFSGLADSLRARRQTPPARPPIWTWWTNWSGPDA
jgi:hypothetical protein